jgi:hypothetical protein
MKKERKAAGNCSLKSLLGDPGIGKSIINIAHALNPLEGELWVCSPATEGVQMREIPQEMGLEEGYQALLCPSHEQMLVYIAIAYTVRNYLKAGDLKL